MPTNERHHVGWALNSCQAAIEDEFGDSRRGLKLDFEDEVIAGACITRGGEIVHEGAKAAAGAAAPA